MSALKKLAGQTAVYGLSSILGRLLNYLLVPLHTYFFLPEAYGEVGVMYAYVAFFMVLLMAGMETTFFRFVNKAEDKEKIFNQAFSIVLVINVFFILNILLFSQSIANFIDFPQHKDYVIWFGFILVFDAISSLFLAKLRHQEEPKKFAIIQLTSIGVNILLNLVLLFAFASKKSTTGIEYIFIANLAASAVKPIMLYKDILSFRFVWDKVMAKTMLVFSFPLLIGSFAGIINETLDRILLNKILTKSHNAVYADIQVGIYNANYKLSILITLFIQAFRYAAEPFFFAQEKNKEKDKVYSTVMTYFVIVVSLMFLVISLNLDIFKLFIRNDAYYEGLKIVPILLLANVFLGIYYNQSIWYKLADKTKFGAYIALVGASLTIGLNIILIPFLGYMGSAWTTLIVYFSMSVISYFLGHKYYPIQYNLKKVLFFLSSAIVLFFIGKLLTFENSWTTFIAHSVVILIYIGLIYIIEMPNLKTLIKRKRK
jgi:O-antigen/teichoic acid export membrane protein